MYLLLLSFICIFSLVATQAIYNVNNYGAIASDGADDTAAFTVAFNAANSMPGSTIQIGGTDNGHYHLKNTLFIGSNIVAIDGMGSTLIMTNHNQVLNIQSASNLVVRNLIVDYSPDPFTGGRITSTELPGFGPPRIYINITSPHFIDKEWKGRRVESIVEYDGARQRPATSGWQSTETGGGGVGALHYDSGNRVILYPSATKPLPAALEIGDDITIRFAVSGLNAIVVRDSENITFDGVIVHSSFGYALAIGGTKHLRMLNTEVKRRTGKWQSSNAGAIQLSTPRGYVEFKNVLIDGPSGYGLRVLTPFLQIRQKLPANGVRLSLHAEAATSTPDIRIGDTLDFGQFSAPFLAQLTRQVVDVSVDSVIQLGSPKTVSVILSEPLPSDYIISSESLVYVIDPQHSLLLDEVTVQSNRGIGLVLGARNVLVQNSRIIGVSGAAVRMTVDATTRYAGIPCRNVTFKNNAIRSNNYGIASQSGIITMDYEVPSQWISRKSFNEVHSRVIFSENDFLFPQRNLFHVQSVNNLYIGANSFRTMAVNQFVSEQCNSKTIFGYNSYTGVEERSLVVPAEDCSLVSPYHPRGLMLMCSRLPAYTTDLEVHDLSIMQASVVSAGAGLTPTTFVFGGEESSRLLAFHQYLDPVDAFSVLAVVRLGARIEGSGKREICRLFGTSLFNVRLAIEEDGRLMFEGTQRQGGAVEVHAPSVNVFNSNWHHVAVTYNGLEGGVAMLRLFFDGVVVHESSVWLQFVGARRPVLFGAGLSGAATHFEYHTAQVSEAYVMKCAIEAGVAAVSSTTGVVSSASAPTTATTTAIATTAGIVITQGVATSAASTRSATTVFGEQTSHVDDVTTTDTSTVDFSASTVTTVTAASTTAALTNPTSSWSSPPPTQITTLSSTSSSLSVTSLDSNNSGRDKNKLTESDELGVLVLVIAIAILFVVALCLVMLLVALLLRRRAWNLSVASSAGAVRMSRLSSVAHDSRLSRRSAQLGSSSQGGDFWINNTMAGAGGGGSTIARRSSHRAARGSSTRSLRRSNSPYVLARTNSRSALPMKSLYEL